MMLYREESNSIVSSQLEKYSFVSSGFTTRTAGDCRKIENIQKYLKQNGIFARKKVLLEQIHSSHIAKPDPLHLGEIEFLEDSDGVLTRETGACLIVRVADCVPILYFDPVRRIIGVSHNGWRGTEKNMVGEMVEVMKQNGSRSEHIRLAIGPAINSCCYTIDVDRYAQFMESMERFNAIAFKAHGSGFRVNLLRLNVELAREAGVLSEHIDFFPFCTSCDAARFYSYRRQYKTHPSEFGEMMGYIMLN